MTATLSPVSPGVCNPLPEFDPSRLRNGGELLDFFRYLYSLPSAHTDGYVFPKNRTLAAKFGKSVRTIQRWVETLEAAGAIVIEQIEGMERRIHPQVSPAPLHQIRQRGVAAIADVARRVARSVIPDVTPLPDRARERKERGRDNNQPPTVDHVVVPSSKKPEPIDLETRCRAEEAVRAYAQTHEVKSWGALLRTAIREKWMPPAPVSEHPSDNGGRAVRVVRAPADYLARVAAEQAPQGSTKAVHAPLPTGGGRDAFRATVAALRGQA